MTDHFFSRPTQPSDELLSRIVVNISDGFEAQIHMKYIYDMIAVIKPKEKIYFIFSPNPFICLPLTLS